MLHVAPILCLIIFVAFAEFRLKQEFNEIKKEFDRLKAQIERNRNKIDKHVENSSNE